MSNHSSQSFGGWIRPVLRSPGAGRGVGALCLLLGALVLASNAMAAEIVEVRVGRHAEFTRIVFELDRAAGYRIERANPSSDVSELVVSLEATSIPRRIQSSRSLIKQVEVEPAGRRSIARIRLSKKGLRLKEMILASPPRIVLDVLSDSPAKPAQRAAAVPTKRTEAAGSGSISSSVASKRAEPAKARTGRSPDEAVGRIEQKSGSERPGSGPSGKTTASAKAAATPSASGRPGSGTGSAAASADRATATSRTASEPPDKDATAAGGTMASAGMAKGADSAKAAMGDEPSTSTPLDDSGSAGAAALADTGSPGSVVPETRPTPPPKARPAPRSMVVQTKPAKDEGGGWMTWALMGAGAIALLVGGLLVARRFRGGEVVDDSGEGESADTGAAAGTDENPFGGLDAEDRQMTLGEAGAAAGSSLGTAGGDTTIVSTPDEEKESEAVAFGDSEEKTMDDMEVISRDQVNESLGGMPPVGGGIPEEFQQMMREMNRRVEMLEGRIDELVDARDRLERQVAAQTEELRVQRAAIARTQRAVRNLARPEDEEQEPTEPALREPNPPGAD
ncbi:MAG TPA: hypothetical protein ENI85_06295 [Deltaproteobacteria bacterium]|nr:hypothetical protein [Deltaproteobacteria bacterium]